MKSITNLILFIFFISICISCKLDKEQPSIKKDNTKTDLQKGVINVVAKDFKFEVNDTIPSGWLTFNLKNAGKMDHFFF